MANRQQIRKNKRKIDKLLRNAAALSALFTIAPDNSILMCLNEQNILKFGEIKPEKGKHILTIQQYKENEIASAAVQLKLNAKFKDDKMAAELEAVSEKLIDGGIAKIMWGGQPAIGFKTVPAELQL